CNRVQGGLSRPMCDPQVLSDRRFHQWVFSGWLTGRLYSVRGCLGPLPGDDGAIPALHERGGMPAVLGASRRARRLSLSGMLARSPGTFAASSPNSRLGMLSTVIASTQRTVAFRGTLPRSAISPKHSPGPSVAKTFSTAGAPALARQRITSARPDNRM